MMVPTARVYRDRMFRRSPETVFNDCATAFGGGEDVQAGFHISYNFTRVSASP